MMQYIKLSIISITIFGLIIGLYFTLITNLSSALIMGTLSGLVSVISIILFNNETMSLKSKDQKNIVIKELVHSGRATRKVGMDYVGGWLVINKKNLIFKSNEIKFQNHNLSISIKDITGIETTNTSNLIPNGIIIQTSEMTYDLFVFNRNQWINKLKDSIEKLQLRFH